MQKCDVISTPDNSVTTDYKEKRNTPMKSVGFPIYFDMREFQADFLTHSSLHQLVRIVQCHFPLMHACNRCYRDSATCV